MLADLILEFRAKHKRKPKKITAGKRFVAERPELKPVLKLISQDEIRNLFGIPLEQLGGSRANEGWILL